MIRSRLARLLALAAVGVTGACSSATGGQGSLVPGAASTPGPSVISTPAGASTPAGSTTPKGTSGAGSGGPSTPAAEPGPAAFTDPATVARILTDAKRDVAVTNSYDYRHLAQSLSAALALTTGDFRTQYGTAFRNTIEPEAPRLHARQDATVNAAGIAGSSADEAQVMIFGQLVVTNTRTPHGKTQPFAVAAAVRLVAGHWLLAKLVTDGTVTGLPSGTPGLAAALSAVRSGVTALFTLSRAHFDTDYARALAQTTGSLHSDLVERRERTRTSLQDGELDLRGTVRAVAAQTASGTRVVALVRADSAQVTDGKAGTPSPQDLEVTAEFVQGRWLLSDLSSAGIR